MHESLPLAAHAIPRVERTASEHRTARSIGR